MTTTLEPETDDQPTTVETVRPTVTMRSRRMSLRIERRLILVCLILAAIALGVMVVSLATGDFPIAIRDVVATLFGQGSSRHNLIVLEWRLPRALMALVLGGALGMSGAIFQSLTRNPLGSPDIIGFNTGAYTGALIAIIIVGGDYVSVAIGALGGGLVTAAVVYVLAYRKGMQGFRLIIVGIAVSAMLASFNTWMILRADLEVAMSVIVRGAGSLSGISWPQAVPALFFCAVLTLLALIGDYSGLAARAGRRCRLRARHPDPDHSPGPDGGRGGPDRFGDGRGRTDRLRGPGGTPAGPSPHQGLRDRVDPRRTHGRRAARRE